MFSALHDERKTIWIYYIPFDKLKSSGFLSISLFHVISFALFNVVKIACVCLFPSASQFILVTTKIESKNQCWLYCSSSPCMFTNMTSTRVAIRLCMSITLECETCDFPFAAMNFSAYPLRYSRSYDQFQQEMKQIMHDHVYDKKGCLSSRAHAKTRVFRRGHGTVSRLLLSIRTAASGSTLVDLSKQNAYASRLLNKPQKIVTNHIH